jgi:hypothetical protein
MRKTLAGTAVLFLLPVAAAGQHRIEVNLHWITDTAGCKIWDSRPMPGETVSWSGACRGGYAEGKGILIWYVRGQLHSTYEGELSGGHYEGRGTQVWSSGARYEGDWQSDRAHGKGTYRAATGEVCSGAWVDGCFQGDCSYTVGTASCPEKK